MRQRASTWQRPPLAPNQPLCLVLLRPRLRAKPVRTASGIAVVAVMSKPHRCPHIATTGNICVYCPGGPDSDFEYSTQSYTGYEPTSMRAIRARYDPYVQARTRVEQLRRLGHSVDKVRRAGAPPARQPVHTHKRTPHHWGGVPIAAAGGVHLDGRHLHVPPGRVPRLLCAQPA